MFNLIHYFMKKLFVLIMVVLAYGLGRIQEHESSIKDYHAACLQADFIRYLIDHFDGETEMFNIGAEIENSYEEYFGDVYEYGTKIKSINDFNEYYWSY